MAKVLIGTSGWIYKDWWGRFYSEKLPQSQTLEFYSKTFDTVELNASFYHLPLKKNFKNWYKRTPSNFYFSVKGNKYITQNLKLSNPSGPVGRFFSESSGLGEKLEVVLWQLPPNFGKDIKRLENFLKEVNLTTENLKLKTKSAFEFRHLSWLSTDIYDLLKKYKAGWVIQNSSTWQAAEEVTSSFVYLRFHGLESLYSSNYSEAELKKWAEKINKWHNQGLTVYAYFNNDTNAYAVKNALRLKELVEK